MCNYKTKIEKQEIFVVLKIINVIVQFIKMIIVYFIMG